MEELDQLLKALWHAKEYIYAIFFFFFSCGITVELFPKIKIKPISAILGWIGKKIMSSTTKYVDERVQNLKEEINVSIAQGQELKKDVESMATELDDYKCESMRGIILDFAASIRVGEHHTYDQYARVFNTYRNYMRLINKRGFDNEVVEQDMAFIERNYQKLLDEGKLSPKPRK